MRSLIQSRKGKTTLAGLIAIFVVMMFGAESCDESSTSTADKASAARNKGVDVIRANQPVDPMNYSPTLNTINKWADTWGKQGVVAYVYMKRQDGSFDGYYVLDGLPVNGCVGGSPPVDKIKADLGDYNGDAFVPAPGLDGAYYGGCDPNRYYGFDAVTGQYIEYEDGFILTAVVSNQPLPQQVQPYVSSIEQVKKDG